MVAFDGLILVATGIALLLAAWAASRSPSETVRRMAQDALSQATETRSKADGFIAEARTILAAIEDERERTIKAAARARAQTQRAEQAQLAHQPQSRDEEVAMLRSKAGLM